MSITLQKLESSCPLFRMKVLRTGLDRFRELGVLLPVSVAGSSQLSHGVGDTFW